MSVLLLASVSDRHTFQRSPSQLSGTSPAKPQRSQKHLPVKQASRLKGSLGTGPGLRAAIRTSVLPVQKRWTLLPGLWEQCCFTETSIPCPLQIWMRQHRVTAFGCLSQGFQFIPLSQEKWEDLFFQQHRALEFF